MLVEILLHQKTFCEKVRYMATGRYKTGAPTSSCPYKLMGHLPFSHIMVIDFYRTAQS